MLCCGSGRGYLCGGGDARKQQTKRIVNGQVNVTDSIFRKHQISIVDFKVLEVIISICDY